MSQDFLNRNNQNNANSDTILQKKPDAQTQLGWVNNQKVDQGFGVFGGNPTTSTTTQLATKEEDPITKEEAKKKLVEYKKSLTEKLEKEEDYIPLPEIIYVEKGLGSNAQYHSQTKSILIGPNFFNKGKVEGDQISIIYHEYAHYLNDISNKYPLTYDENGVITQWTTDIMISTPPTASEIEKGVLEMMGFLPESTSDEDRKKMEESYRSMLSLPTETRWRYAPSNLSLDEISAYKSQLEGYKNEYYDLSPEYIKEIEERIISYMEQYARRVEYEKNNNLNADGSKKTE